MSATREEMSVPYWGSGFEAGTSSTWTFEGTGGAARLGDRGPITALGTERFRARLTRLQLDHVALEAFAASPHRFERTAEVARTDRSPMLMFVLLAAGRLQVTLAHRSFDLDVGQFVLVDSREPTAYRADSDVRLLRAMVGIEHLPTALQGPDVAVPLPLRRTPLADSFVAFVSTLLKSAASGRHAEGEHLIRAVADLLAGVVAEARQEADPLTGATGLRYRMQEYIERNVADPDLGPRAVAEAVGISLRHAHGIFNEGDQTIARYIRERRITAVAQELSTSPRRPRPAELAERYGFSSVDTLGRAFRNRYGTTLGGYRTHGPHDQG